MVKDPMFPMITDLNNPEQGVRDWLSARRRIKAKIDADKWNEQIALFQQYKSVKGNCDVPRSHKVGDVNLGRWVDTQRHQYQLYQKGQPSQMTQERIQQLNGLGFIWVVGKGRGETRAKADASKWDKQFRLLQQYKSVNGDCDVQRSHKVGDVNLGRWVDRQRIQYQLFQKGQPSQMTQERIQQLNGLDFIWVVGKGNNQGKRK
jgi:peptide deformylase